MAGRVALWIVLLAALATLLATPAAQAQARPKAKLPAKPRVTTIYIVRHAEKDSTANSADPGLSPLGEVRAQALRQLMLRHRPVAIFTTDTKRTRATVAPLASATGLEPQVYDPKDPTALAVRIRKEYTGKAVLVVGHSNTILPLIESLGGTKPVEEIGDKDYDYLFTVRMPQGALATVAVQGYGPDRRLTSGAKPLPRAK